MKWQQLTRRTVLGAAVVLVAASTALGTGHVAHAVDDGAYPINGYISREHFKELCEIMDGTFSTDKYGNTNCEYPDGSTTQCDINGSDCWRTPARQRPGAEQTHDETGPMYESPTETDVGPSNGRGELIELGPKDADVVADGTGGASPGEQAPSGPSTRTHTETAAPEVGTGTLPDTQPQQESVPETGAVVAVSAEEQP